MTKDRKLGLVLPGGGFHGPFQAGVLKFFEEKGIKFDYIIASSVDIVNASILGAKDGSAEKICEFWRKTRYYHFFHLAWRDWFRHRRVDSLCTNKKLEQHLLKFADIYDQRDDVDVEISLLNLDSGQVEYVSNHSSDFQQALWAGITIAPFYPAVFLPERGSQYVDGGLGRNYMIPRCFEKGCDYVILVNLIETQKTRANTEEERGTVRDLKRVFWRTATLVIKRVFADSSGQARYDNDRVLKMFSPSGTYFSTLFPSNWWFRRMIKAGYEEAERVYRASSFFRNI